ncbi:MAG: GSCFA domain-containing protein [Cytophagales bacterium]|nr:GSCFA domain-containing protein [Cytophagales bacterium]MDW8383354.1 GSCFA domain-containing protein [Flammeovirgaceae bacterium]
MDFRTIIPVAFASQQYNLSHHFLTMGSCFAEHIGNFLFNYKFQTITNPFGTIFNPLSVCKLLTQKNINPHRFVCRDEIWHHLDFHSSFWATSRENLFQKIQQTFDKVRLEQIDVLIFTLGTAWVYEWKSDNQTVANCHKLPSDNFRKRLLEVDEIVQGIQNLLNQYPHLHIILTVSPVRHLKDTLLGNAVSKSVLRLACHFLSRYERIFYFPAYEILLDDLRDYRFYEPDMIHPTAQAVEYICQHFSQCFLDESAQTWIKKWKAILQQLHHQPFYSQSKPYKSFLENLLSTLQQIKETDVSQEISQVQKILESFSYS